MPGVKKNLFLMLIVLIGLTIRLYKINIPLLEFYPSRQVQTSDITRNYIKNQFNLLTPTISYLGSEYTPFLIEFPGYNFIVAAFYYIFGINEAIGRLVSVFGWLIAVILIYKIGHELSLKRTAIYIAVLFYTLSPLSVLISRSFQPDQWMLTFSLAGILYFLRWHKRRNTNVMPLSIFFISISLLIKMPSAIFTLLPILAFLLIDRSKTIKTLFIYAVICLIPTFLWYLWAYFQKNSNQAAIGGFSFSNWFGLDVFLNPKYWANVFGFEYNLVLLPLGMLLFIVGILTKLKKEQRFLYFWLFAVFLYFLLFNKHNMTHEYYHLPLIPVASLFIGIAGERVVRSLTVMILPKKVSLAILFVALFALMIIPTIQRAYKPIERFRNVVEVANKIKSITKPNDLVIGSMDAGPALVYYSDRHGWGFDVERDQIASELIFYGVRNPTVLTAVQELERLKSQGAVIFASAYKKQFLSNREFADYMYANYSIIEDNEDYVIFSLVGKWVP